jgi:ADP-ribose pyrophosphatase
VENSDLRPWKTISRETILDHSDHLRVENHAIQLPDGEVIKDWPWIILPDAVIVLAQTTNGNYLCFRQTKYAVEGTSLAPVGGLIEPEEKPLNAAKRELLEETGYSSKEWTDLGSYVLEPNRGVAVANLFLARGALKVAEPVKDDLEDQQLLLLDRIELEQALARREFKVITWATIVALALLHTSRRVEG